MGLEKRPVYSDWDDDMFQDAMNATDPDDFSAAGPIEHITDHVMLEWLHDGKVVVLTVTSMDFSHIDAWSVKAIEIAQDCARQGKPYLVIHDVSAQGLSFTPYIREKTKDTIREQKGARGRTAVVVPTSWPGMMLRLFINQLMRIVVERPIQGFRTREEAVAWVAEAIE